MYKLTGSEEVSNDLHANLKVTHEEFKCPGPVWEKVTVTGMTEGGQQGPGTAQGHSRGGPGGCQVEKATAARCLPPRQTGQPQGKAHASAWPRQGGRREARSLAPLPASRGTAQRSSRREGDARRRLGRGQGRGSACRGRSTGAAHPGG